MRKLKVKIENVEKIIKQLKRMYKGQELRICFDVRQKGVYLSGTEPLHDDPAHKPDPQNLIENLVEEDDDKPELELGEHIG